MPSYDDQPSTPGPDKGNFDSGFITGQIRHQSLSARVPDAIAPGVFSTGVIIHANANEFVLDFLCRMTRPFRVAARVILPPPVMPQTIAALRENIGKFTDRFGPIPQLPKPDNDQRPTIQEIYDDLKLPDNVLVGAYANAVMIGHTPAEFSFDFIVGFFPRSAVSARVFLSAPHVPRVLDSMTHTYNDYQRRIAAATRQPITLTPPPITLAPGTPGNPINPNIPDNPSSPNTPENPGPDTGGPPKA